MVWNITYMLHVLAAVTWVGALVATIVGVGMLGRQPDDQALGAYRTLSAKVVIWIHVAMLLSWATGLWMMFVWFDGFGSAGAHVDIMFLLALLMTILLIVSMAGPRKRFSRAATNIDARAALDGVRQFAMIGLALALLTIAVASVGPF